MPNKITIYFATLFIINAGAIGLSCAAPSDSRLAAFFGVAEKDISVECPQDTYSIVQEGKVDTLRMWIRAGKNEKRCEIAVKTLSKDSKLAQRVSFDVMQPSTNISKEWYAIMQIHSFPDKNLGEVWRCPPLSFEAMNRGYRAFSRWDKNEKSLTSGYNCTEEGSTIKARELMSNVPVLYDSWQKLTLDIVMSPFDDGQVRLAVGRFVSPVFKGGTRFNDAKPPYLKFGIYKPAGWTAEERQRGQDLLVFYKNVEIPHFPSVSKKSLSLQQ